ncbi:hypothetical protein K449DRAFT_334702 [Hypoxylon sp. EC38]|nr:hypothetical protein K449DRAFT_334702 [Hypoxylon sp. EC38]
MSRPGPSSGRNLTLTEELERLEQSITLTLQEIDHNFSKAHRIVTTSILPLVEQYGEHSKAVWEASQFWKQFFEASANVSLSGYEELAGDETTNAEETTLDETTSDYNNTTVEADVTAEHSGYAGQHQGRQTLPDDSLLDDAEMTGSTPRPPATKSLTHLQQPKSKPQFAGFVSPYEKLRRELGGENTVYKKDLELETANDDDDDDDTMELPAQPTRTITQTRLPDMSMTPRSSSLLEAPRPSPRSARTKIRCCTAELYHMSPMKLARARSGAGLTGDAPRTPGVSVQTPATARKTRDVFAEGKGKGLGLDLGLGKGKKREPDEITWESDEDDDFGGMSPPKTIQFALPPSKLLQTPAREASKRIVDDILITAGANPEDSSEYSPTMVKMNQDILDDTF